MLNKLFGKYAGIASAAIMLVIAVVTHVKPELLSNELAVNILLMFGIHGTASASAIVK